MTDDDQLEKTRQQAVLANPEGCTLEQLVTALDTLDDDERLAWLEENPEVYEELDGPWSEMLEAVVDALTNGFRMELRERLEVEIDTGIYENTSIHTPDGETHPAGEVYLWAKCLDGRYNADIKERNVPPVVDLEECDLEIHSDDGVPLLRAAIVDEPNETLGNSLCLKLEPAGPADD